MGQKVNPNGLRIGVNRDWEAKWIAGKKDFGGYLIEDNKIRNFIKNEYQPKALKKDENVETPVQEGEVRPVRKFDDRPRISKICIDRCSNYIKVRVFTGRAGLLIGKDGQGTESIRSKVIEICKACGHNYPNYYVEFVAVKSVDSDAQLVAEEVANQLEKRVSFRRAIKTAMRRAEMAGAEGIKVMVSGRLDGAEIARSEQYHQGSIPLQTLRAKIDYGFAEANTTYGKIGVKAWIYHGSEFGKKGGK